MPAASKEKRSPVRRHTPAGGRLTRSRVVRILLLFLASAIAIDGLVGERGLLAMLRARHEYDELALSLANQRAENAQLREQARRLREDPAMIEEIARRELGLIRPGEKVFILKDVTAATAPPKTVGP